MPQLRSRLAASLLAVAMAASSTPAWPQPTAGAETRSRELFGKGKALGDQGKWNEACPILQEAHDLNATNGTAFQLANCYERIGQPDKAYPLYERIVQAGDAKYPERVEYARTRMAEIDRARAEARPPPPASPPPPPVAPAPATPAPLASTQATGARAPDRIPAYVAFGVGAVGLGLGAAFGVAALAQARGIDDVCPKGVCPTEADRRAQRSEQDGATAKGWVSNVALGVGVVGVAVGIVLLATGRPARSLARVRGVELRF